MRSCPRHEPLPTMDTQTKEDGDRGASLEERFSLFDRLSLRECVLSLVGHAARKVAPIPRRGSRLGAPRSVAMTGLLDSLPTTRKRIDCASKHAIQDVLCASRLTTCRNRFRFEHRVSRRSTSCARPSMRFDKSESYVVRRFTNQMFRRPSDEKKFTRSKSGNARGNRKRRS